MTKHRLEAFSDGVIAIIITIMVLELKVPEGHDWNALLGLWPKALSYLVSFLYVGIYWNNHHHLFQTVQRVDGNILWANLHLLFWLSVFPLVTAWAGESHFAAVPMSCYGAVALLAAIAYTLLTRAIVRADPRHQLLTEAMGDELKERVSISAYLVAVIAPFFGPLGAWLSGLMMVLVALIWLLPDRRIEGMLARAQADLGGQVDPQPPEPERH